MKECGLYAGNRPIRTFVTRQERPTYSRGRLGHSSRIEVTRPHTPPQTFERPIHRPHPPFATRLHDRVIESSIHARPTLPQSIFMEHISAELHLLVWLLRSALGTAESPAPATSALDWDIFVAAVERHRVGAYLQQLAAPPIAALCPPAVVLRVKTLSTTTLHRALQQGADQVRLIRSLESAGIEVMTVKGLALAQRLHGQLGLRHVGDIDLVVRPSDAGRADAVLREVPGLFRFRPDIPLTPLQLKKFVELKPEFEYRRASPALRVELLWRLEGLPETEEVWSRAVTCSVGGQPMRTLPPDLDVLYLLQHGARHGWFRLFWLLDAALLLRDPSLDWERLMARARQMELERPLLQAAALASEILGVSPPAALKPAPHEAGLIAALCAESHRQILRAPREHEGLTEWTRQLGYRTRLQKSVRKKFAVIAPHLFTPESWRTLPLPDRWFFVYYFATPFLWLWRRLMLKFR